MSRALQQTVHVGCPTLTQQPTTGRGYRREIPVQTRRTEC